MQLTRPDSTVRRSAGSVWDLFAAVTTSTGGFWRSRGRLVRRRRGCCQSPLAVCPGAGLPHGEALALSVAEQISPAGLCTVVVEVLVDCHHWAAGMAWY